MPPESAPPKPIVIAEMDELAEAVRRTARPDATVEPEIEAMTALPIRPIVFVANAAPIESAPPPAAPPPIESASAPLWAVIVALFVARTSTSAPARVRTVLPFRISASVVPSMRFSVAAPAPKRPTPPPPPAPTAAPPATLSARMADVVEAATVTLPAPAPTVPTVEPSITARVTCERVVPATVTSPIWFFEDESALARPMPPAEPPAIEIASPPAVASMLEASVAVTFTVPPGLIVLGLIAASTVLPIAFWASDPDPASEMPPTLPPEPAPVRPRAKASIAADSVALTTTLPVVSTVEPWMAARTVFAIRFTAHELVPAKAIPPEPPKARASEPEPASASIVDESLAATVSDAANTVLAPRTSASITFVIVFSEPAPARPTEIPPVPPPEPASEPATARLSIKPTMRPKR